MTIPERLGGPAYAVGGGRICDRYWHALAIRWAGERGALWFVRVEMFVANDSGRFCWSDPGCAVDAFSARRSSDRSGHGTDQGTGMASPVIGMTFFVAAGSPGQAAQTAVEIAAEALGDENRGLDGVSAFPASQNSAVRIRRRRVAASSRLTRAARRPRGPTAA